MSEGGDEAGNVGRPTPVWEKPWSLDEMRKGAAEWSLASDSGVSDV